VVADSIGDPTTSTTDDVDGVGYAFVAANYQYSTGCALPTLFLPTGGLINSSTTTGLSFQLAPYDNLNDLRLTGAASASLNFGTPASAQTVFLLGTSGSGASTINATVNFSDGTSQTFKNISIPDWFQGTTNIAIEGVGRVNTAVGACGGFSGSSTTPLLYQLPLTISSTNYSKIINSVTITCANTGNSVVNIMGVSIEAPPTACNGTPNVGSTIISATSVCSGSYITLSLQYPLTNTSGLTYQWQSSPDSLNWTNLAGEDSATNLLSLCCNLYQ
jgi:hypothetical protein